jgi:hypothetical protein
MKTEWRDPDDTRPSATRAPRKITGYRSWCPLRRMRSVPGSKIEERHILAADRLRRIADIAAIGMSAGVVMEPRTEGYGPSAGPSEAKMGQARAAHEVQQALGRFPPEHRQMLIEVVLLNRSLAQWCAMYGGDPKVEMGKLLFGLDLLCQHYQQEIDEDIDAERLMGEA